MAEATVDQLRSMAAPVFSARAAWAVGGLAALVLGSWLLSTPPGLLGKADAVGYAVCHRIDLRSFHLGDRQLPLCARCSGTFLGALVGMMTLAAWGRSRSGGFPSRALMVVLFAFIGVMGFDGVNSYLTLFPGLPHLYEPQNWLRLTTGMFNGLAVGMLIYPAFNQTLWQHWTNEPALRGFRELGWLAVIGVGLVVLVLGENPVILYPLALLSAAGVVVMLTVLNTVVLLMLLRRENRVEHWSGALAPLLAGFTLAMLEIAAVDAVRYAIFQTWAGFPLPG